MDWTRDFAPWLGYTGQSSSLTNDWQADFSATPCTEAHSLYCFEE